MKIIILFLLTMLLALVQTHGQSILINEFMSDNEMTIQDIDGEYSDWIELYNNSNSDINLLNYSLSDDINDLNKWVFPNIIMESHSYLLIFASNKNILDTDELHTNFKISSNGEAIFLSDNLGIVIDQTTATNLSIDEAYGRVPDGNINWIYISTPSPDTSNNLSNQLIFSVQEGFYTTPFHQKINSLLGDTVYYTLDGSLPTENSNIYTDSIFINNTSASPNVFSEIQTSPEQNLISYKAWESPNTLVDKATVLRCASFRNGIRTTSVYTKSFFVEEEIFEKYSLPVISLVTDGNNFFSPDTGIYVPGVNYDPNNPEWTGNYFRTDWEKPIHIEYFETNGVLSFSQNAGVKIHGGKTRHAAQKSLKLYARNEYGKKYFNHKLLPQKENSKYKRFLLRTTMGAWGGQSIIKDDLGQSISSNLDIDYQNSQPVVVFINGEYWGIHVIKDKIDENYIEYTYNINKDSVEFKEWYNPHYDSLINFIELNGLSNNSNYEYIKTQIDINNFIDYNIAEQFFRNYDWPGNNMKLWRPIPNGKWRWVMYDLDAAFTDQSYDMLTHSTANDNSVIWPNPPTATFLFRSLLENDRFKSRFIARYAEILNTDFSTKKMINQLDSIMKIYDPEVAQHISRWNFPDNYSKWKEEIESGILSFIENRPCYVEYNILEFFDLTEFGFSCPKIVSEKNFILAPNPNNGVFFIYNNSTDIDNLNITINSMNGRNVYHENNISLNTNEYKYFNLPHLSSGTYVLQFVSKDYNEQIKFVLIQ